ncbi:class I SAM-dependent methyltransferase [Methanobacterium sp. SMA-27]|uniref:class I SAM-dependent methyltransferase n=1 Tax=Methanobacterium sp. SMA-27 TaxID=1495336 RepID=UPI00064E2BBB|nr:methyltransferase domain-containing protein [Methanobacterium sp. SMA-27]
MKSTKMDSDQIKKIESEMWKGPSCFDVKSQSIADKYNNEWNDFLLKKSIKNLDLKGKRVINVGGGNGNEAEFLIKNGVKKLLLVDIAPGQLESAKIRIKEHKLNNLELELGDAENLKHNDKSFDICYIYLALHHFPNHNKSISEICRVSKEVIFVDIMDAKLTKFLNLLGLFKEEWCGIEPNRLDENRVKNIFNERGMNMKIQYFFFPPYYGDNNLTLNMIKLISRYINIFMKFKLFNALFGNVSIIKGTKK